MGKIGRRARHQQKCPSVLQPMRKADLLLQKRNNSNNKPPPPYLETFLEENKRFKPDGKASEEEGGRGEERGKEGVEKDEKEQHKSLIRQQLGISITNERHQTTYLKSWNMSSR